MKDNNPLLGSPRVAREDCSKPPSSANGNKLPDKAGTEANVESAPSAEAVHEALADNLRNASGASFIYCSVAVNWPPE